MADTAPKIIQPTSKRAEPVYSSEERTQKEGAKQGFLSWDRLSLGGILLISVIMNFFQLGQNGYGSYYPPAIRSMMDNWHNFFFAAYDPGAYVTVDKPPVGFWFDVLSAKIFGFNSVSILLPQALSGVLAVLLLYYLVRRYFGTVAGLLAALALALSPISIITNRNITIDSILALTLLVGAWAVLRAAETGKLRWLLLSALIVGIGFNIKMLEAYLVVPAYGVLYLFAAPKSIWKRIGHLALAGLVLLAVSFSWIVAVDLTPASQRPYVDSTQDNSELSLAIGYNGIERLLGRFGFGGRGFGAGAGARPTTPTNTTPRTGTTGGTGTSTTPGNGGAANPGGNGTTPRTTGGFAGIGGIFDTGGAGPLRLFTQPLAGQIAWFLPLALLGILAVAWQRRPRPQSDRQQQAVLFWGMWLLTMGIFFSVAGFFHQYYMTEMSPAIAALFGIGLVVMWKDYRSGNWRGWLLPFALAVTAAEQIYILSFYPTWGQWLIPLIIIVGILAVGALVVARVAPRLRLQAPGTRFILPALGALLLALMIAPALWAAIPILTSKQADTLVAGPTQGNDFGGGNFGGRFGGNANSDAALIRYLEANQGNTKFLVAVPSSNMADSLILATNKPVMAMGGFSGSDPILTTSQLATMVSNGTIRFFLLNSVRVTQPPTQTPSQNPGGTTPNPTRGTGRGFGGFGGFGGGQQSALTSWVTQHCSTVPASQWQSSSTSINIGGGTVRVGQQLYDCATAH